MTIYQFRTQILKTATENNFIRVQDRQDGTAFTKSGLFVIASLNTELDNNQWIHVSLSKQNKLPTYNDIKLVKNIFIGKYKKAIQIFPSETEHVNYMKYCLHIWHCVNHDPLPDFTHGKHTL